MILKKQQNKGNFGSSTFRNYAYFVTSKQGCSSSKADIVIH